MKATKEIVEKRVVEALSATPIKEFTVDKSLEAYALYNALVGTTFDAESYKTLVEDEVGVQYLYDHIPGGAKLIKEGEQAEESTTEQEQTPNATPTEPDAEHEIKSEAETEVKSESEPEAEPNAEPVVESEPETTTVPEVTSEEVEEHKGEEVTEENEKFDIDKDGDIDNEDVAKASEIEVV